MPAVSSRGWSQTRGQIGNSGSGFSKPRAAVHEQPPIRPARRRLPGSKGTDARDVDRPAVVEADGQSLASLWVRVAWDPPSDTAQCCPISHPSTPQSANAPGPATTNGDTPTRY